MEHGQQLDQFGRGATLGYGDHDIFLSDQAQIPMQGIGGVKKGRWGAGAVERGHCLAGHIRTLSDAGEDQPTTALTLLENRVDGAFEILPDSIGQRRNRLGLHAQGAQGRFPELSALGRR